MVIGWCMWCDARKPCIKVAASTIKIRCPIQAKVAKSGIRLSCGSWSVADLCVRSGDWPGEPSRESGAERLLEFGDVAWPCAYRDKTHMASTVHRAGRASHREACGQTGTPKAVAGQVPVRSVAAYFFQGRSISNG